MVPDDSLTALLKACHGKDFRAKRDEAIIRVFWEMGGHRLAEMAGMRLDSIARRPQIIKATGKGNKSRLIPYGAKIAVALDRYLRLRAMHRYASSPYLRVSRYGRLTPSGIAQLLTQRARLAEIGSIHPHQLRHTDAHTWFANGGSESDAMMLSGWSSREMPARYGRSAAAERAQNASRRASLGDRL